MINNIEFAISNFIAISINKYSFICLPMYLWIV